MFDKHNIVYETVDLLQTSFCRLIKLFVEMLLVMVELAMSKKRIVVGFA